MGLCAVAESPLIPRSSAGESHILKYGNDTTLSMLVYALSAKKFLAQTKFVKKIMGSRNLELVDQGLAVG